MSDLKLFRVETGSVAELSGAASPLEKKLQTLFEHNLEALLGVRFLASEYATTHGGRMDSLGLDENACPVIIEYKRHHSQNVINQGLFYLDWLVDHRAAFELLVRDRYDKQMAGEIEWGAPRLICIAADFTKYDQHAVKQMSRNIELVRYRHFGDNLLLLDLLTSVSEDAPVAAGPALSAGKIYKSVSDSLGDAGSQLVELYSEVEDILLGLGDDVSKKTLQNYFAFRRIKNFACVEVKPSLGVLRLYLKVAPDDVTLEEGFTRDVRNVGHFGTGDLEVTIGTAADLERAMTLITQSYEGS